MRVKGFKWAGHLVRMFDNRIISYERIKSQRKKAQWKAKEWIKRQSVKKLLITSPHQKRGGMQEQDTGLDKGRKRKAMARKWAEDPEAGSM
jgi:hypothetical protein